MHGNKHIFSFQFFTHAYAFPLQSHVGMEVVCGNLRARLVSANLGGMTFELLDENNKVRPTGYCFFMPPPKRRQHQKNCDSPEILLSL